MITENGWSDKGELNDHGRIVYFHDHLNELLNAILDDECNVNAYLGEIAYFWMLNVDLISKQWVLYIF